MSFNVTSNSSTGFSISLSAPSISWGKVKLSGVFVSVVDRKIKTGGTFVSATAFKVKSSGTFINLV